MDERESLGKVAYEARRAFFIEADMFVRQYPPWEKLHEQDKQSYIASGESVANYVKRDMAAMQFSAFVAAGTLDLEERITKSEQRLAEMEETNARNGKEIERLTALLKGVQASKQKAPGHDS